MTTTSKVGHTGAAKVLYAGLLLAGAAGRIGISPKWNIPILAWIVPSLLLFYFRHSNSKWRVWSFMLVFIISQLITSYNVAPFPLSALVIVCMIESFKVTLVFSIDRWVTRRHHHFITTLVFPAVFVTKEYIDLLFSGGAWWSIANTQYHFNWLTQLASLTGLSGISFLIYWFASLAVWCAERYYQGKKITGGILVYGTIFSIVMLFGVNRYYSNDLAAKAPVKVAGLSVPNIGILENIYRDVYHHTIVIDPKSSPTSNELQQVNKALVPFIQDPDPSKFINTYRALDRLQDSLFALSHEAVEKGATIIEWSEGNAIMTTAMQGSFIKRGQDFAATNKIYLLMGMAVFEPGEVTPERMFLENKTVLVGPDGKILNVFHKNHPVPFAERSVPGDGKIPAIATPFGIVSISICYDADLPEDMRQLAKNRSDVLLLPSGDWYDIAPFHSYMAMFRGIENGCTVIRQASGGLSLATDYRGKTEKSFDFYQEGQKLWVSDITIGHVTTVYARIGDAFAYLNIVFTSITLLYMISRVIGEKRTKTFKTPVREAAEA